MMGSFLGHFVFISLTLIPLFSSANDNSKPSDTFARSNIYGRHKKGEVITVEGLVRDEPRLYSGSDGKYKRATFSLTASEKRAFGDEWIVVNFAIVKWGKTVGTFVHKKGDRVRLSGKYFPVSETNRSGLIGTLEVNDLSWDEVHK